MTVAELLLLGAVAVHVAGAWMGIRAKPLAAYLYRWGNYLGAVMTAYGAVLVLAGLWGVFVGAAPGLQLTAFALGAVSATAGLGLLRRSTIGVLALLASAVMLAVVNAIYLPSEAPKTLGALIVIGAPTALYFRKRWSEMRRG